MWKAKKMRPSFLAICALVFVSSSFADAPVTRELCNAEFDKYYATIKDASPHVTTYKMLIQCIDSRVLTREASLGNQYLRAELNIRLLDAGSKAVPIPMHARRDCCEIGMTASEVLESKWGTPNKVNTTVTARSQREQWVYEDALLYFENGVLVTIQTSR